jgi:hypothetical protein
VEDPQQQPEQSGQEPNDDDALGGGREQDDQHADERGADPEVRKLRAEAKRLRLERNDFRDKAKAYEDRDKTEQQRIQDQLAASDKRAAEAEAQLLRYEVAAKAGIPQHAGRLQGSTREALVEDAKTLAKEFGLDGSPAGDGRASFAGGVRRPVQRPKTMNDVIRQASGR